MAMIGEQTDGDSGAGLAEFAIELSQSLDELNTLPTETPARSAMARMVVSS